MNKKDKTIIAIKELIDRYEHPMNNVNYGGYFDERYCPLCEVHKTHSERFPDIGVPIVTTCKGCPQAEKNGKAGCCFDRTYEDAEQWHEDDIGRMFNTSDIIKVSFPKDKPVPKEFIKRASYLKKLLKIIKNQPPIRFTRKGWWYFEERETIVVAESTNIEQGEIPWKQQHR